MRVYAVMSSNYNGDDWLDLVAVQYPHVLVSFVYKDFYVDHAGYRPAFFLDSGAFSVWSLGKEVDLAAYADWALSYSAASPPVANLDVIPGDPAGGPPTGCEREAAVKKGMENADYLRSRGLPVVEVFHRYEPWPVLERLLERRQPGELLAVGGLVGGRDTAEKLRFCDGVFARLRGWCGGWDNLVPVHGFGVSPTAQLGQRYPWFSVDSGSWYQGRMYRDQVGRDGSSGGKVPAGRPVTVAMAHVYFQRILASWKRCETSLTSVWWERGVRFRDEPNQGTREAKAQVEAEAEVC